MPSFYCHFFIFVFIFHQYFPHYNPATTAATAGAAATDNDSPDTDNTDDKDADDALCYGALQIDLPVRYLHIQLRKNHQNITHSLGQLQVSVNSHHHCKLRWEQIDNFDGSYVLRIRLWTSCERLHITIRSPFGTPICNSPIIIQKSNGSPLYAEFCDCPELDYNEWMQMAECAKSYPQLENDLKQWETIDFANVLNEVMQKWASPEQRYSAALCHYQIIDNELYRQCFGEYVGFRVFVDEIFTSIMRKMRLPNTEFVFNLGDWPLQRKQQRNGTAAIASWCGSNDTMDIVLPTYELMKSVLDSMHTISLDIHTAKGTTYWPWRQKKDTAVFRGRDSSTLRLEIALLAEKRPDLLEAGITRYFFFNESLYKPHVKQQPFSDFFQHRYVLSIDGTVAAYRLPFLLAGDSVVFKSVSSFYEHFYSSMQPYVHYIPFQLADIVEKLEWARRTDFNETLRSMRQFVLDNLQPLQLYCYYVRFIERYTKKLKETPEHIGPQMEHVQRNSQHTADDRCKCHRIDDDDDHHHQIHSNSNNNNNNNRHVHVHGKQLDEL